MTVSNTVIPIVPSSFTQFVVEADKKLNKTPFSPINNIVNLFMKAVVLNIAKATTDSWKSNHYFRHLDSTSYERIFKLIIPIFGFYLVNKVDEKDKKNIDRLYDNGNALVTSDISKVVENTKTALNQYYELAAKHGHVKACIRAADLYLEGRFVRQDLQKAFEYYQSAALRGDAHAQYMVGYCLAAGKGVKSDLKLAIEWYKKSAEQKCSKAQNALGDCYYFGNGVKKDREHAYTLYKSAAEKKLPEALYAMGRHEMDKCSDKEDIEGFKHFKEAADLGHDEAAFQVGLCYNQGKGVTRDTAEEFKYFDMAANRRHVYALNARGRCYLNARGTNEDLKKAFENFKEAAEMECIEAKWFLGNCYRKGLGTDKNEAEANRLIGEANAAGFMMESSVPGIR